MNSKQTELSYRRAAVQNASSVGLIIILYDLLTQDLRQAIDAIEKNDVEARSAAIKHSFVVLQQLEGSLDHENGGEAAKNLSRFYSVMRASIFQAHFKVSAEILNEQIRLLLDVRGAWQQVDPANPAAPETAIAATPSAQHKPSAVEGEAATAGWTA